MSQIKRSWDFFSNEKRMEINKEIIEFFKQERNEEIGIIAAENLLDFFLQRIGIETYNKGIEDAKTLLKKRVEDIELDLDLLLKKQ